MNAQPHDPVSRAVITSLLSASLGALHDWRHAFPPVGRSSISQRAGAGNGRCATGCDRLGRIAARTPGQGDASTVTNLRCARRLANCCHDSSFVLPHTVMIVNPDSAPWLAARAALRAGWKLRHPQLREAAVALEKDRTEQAGAILAKFLQGFPGDIDALNLVGELLMRRRRYEDASNVLGECI